MKEKGGEESGLRRHREEVLSCYEKGSLRLERVPLDTSNF